MSKYESIYDILSLRQSTPVNEAEEDTQQPVEAEGGEVGDSIDDDFSIDTSLDDGSPDEDGNPQDVNPEEEQLDNGEPASAGDQEAPVDGDMGAEGEEGGEEEMEANADIFSSLTAEEQQIKIKELKGLYANLYSSIDDILGRINKLDVNEDNLETISRISTCLYDLKIYISDYLTTIFPTKSFIENDVVFVRFLTIVKSVTDILEDVAKKYEKDQKENENQS